MPLVATKGQPLEVTTISGQPVAVYTESGKLTTIDYPHHEIHEGTHYIASYAVDLGNGATHYVLISTPDTTVEPHITINVISEAEAQFDLYETVTYAAVGTAVAAYNRNRRSANTASILVYHTPTTPSVVGATLLQTKHWGAGKTTGADVRGSNEFILARNTKYFLLITNATTSNNYITWWLDWYEHDD